jgi:hypothetical protein
LDQPVPDLRGANQRSDRISSSLFGLLSIQPNWFTINPAKTEGFFYGFSLFLQGCTERGLAGIDPVVASFARHHWVSMSYVRQPGSEQSFHVEWNKMTRSRQRRTIPDQLVLMEACTQLLMGV